jgi:hypothetical protein
MLAKWYKKRGMKVPDDRSLSDSGWIADERVAGFLYLTNSNLALIDCVISNPDTLPSARQQSLQVLLGVLVDTALMLGYTNILGLTKHPNVKALAGKLGFKEIEYKPFLLQEQEEEDVEMPAIEQ